MNNRKVTSTKRNHDETELHLFDVGCEIE